MSELEAIRERHHPGVSPVGGRYDVCDYCGGMWPCDTAVALAEVERLRRAVEERDREIERMALRYGVRQQAALDPP